MTLFFTKYSKSLVQITASSGMGSFSVPGIRCHGVVAIVGSLGQHWSVLAGVWSALLLFCLVLCLALPALWTSLSHSGWPLQDMVWCFINDNLQSF